MRLSPVLSLSLALSFPLPPSPCIPMNHRIFKKYCDFSYFARNCLLVGNIELQGNLFFYILRLRKGEKQENYKIYCENDILTVKVTYNISTNLISDG